MLPKELKRRFKIREIKKSLRTNDLLKARKLANLMHECMKTLFKKAIEGMFNERQFLSLADEFLSRKLETNEDGFSLFTLPQANWTEQDVANQIVLLQDMQNKYKNGLTVFDDTLAYSFLTWLSQEKKISLIENSPDAIKAARAFFKKVIPAADVAIERLKGNYSNEFDNVTLVKTDDASIPQQASVPATATPAQSIKDGRMVTIKIQPQESISEQPTQTNTIGELIKMYIKERLATGRWRAPTIIDFKSHISLFLQYFGEHTPITNIKRQHLTEYRDNIVKRIPKNRVLNKAVKDLSLAEQLADETVEKISIATLNLYIGTIISFFNWCVISDFLTKNPCSSLQLPDPLEGKKRKNSYSNDDLKLIINALAALPQKSKDGVKNIERTWIILLGMYQGMRENEICQLFIDNVVLCGSIPCLHLTRSDKETQSIKNETSFRTLPIHPALLSHGFLDFVNQRKSERDTIMRKRTSTLEDKLTARQLFQTMTHDPRKNNYTKNFLNFFSKFNREIIPDTTKTFHSFRHCFDSFINNHSKIPFAIKYLCGRSLSKIERAYNEAEMQVLLPEISMVNYGFDAFAILRKELLTAEQIAEQAKALPVKIP